MYKACNSRNTKTKTVIKIDTIAWFRRRSSQNDGDGGLMGPGGGGGGLTKYSVEAIPFCKLFVKWCASQYFVHGSWAWVK